MAKAKKTKKKRARRSRPSTVLARPRRLRWLLRIGWVLPVGALVVGSGLLILTYAFASIPLPEEIPLSSSAEVYDRNGRLIGTYTGEVRRFLLDKDQLDDLPDYIADAVISAEDKDFYRHNGVSLRGIARAAWANFTGGEIQQGGSTITQQYIKQAVLQDPSRTFIRKAKEVVLAIKLERRFSKKQILGFYLNTIYLGRGTYGFEAAARTYFDEHAADLTLAQAAFLAAIIPAPESYQPDENRRGATERRDRVLREMVEDGNITRKQAKRASRFPVRMADGLEERTTRTKAAYFMEWLRKEYLYPEYGNDLYTRGMKIYTTLDLDMQRYAEDAVDSILTEPEDPQAALVSMTPTGAVRAMVGGEHYTSVRKSRNFNYASDYPGRHTGSSFKSFTLATAIEEDISPSSVFSGSSPAFIDECPGENGLPPWEVQNYGGSSYGSMSLDSATTNSVNTIYAQVIAEVGPEKVANLLEDFGFHPPPGRTGIAPNCSLSLGAFDATVVEMARGYAAFAGRGALPEVQPIRFIRNAQNECFIAYRPEAREDCREYDRLELEQVIEQNSADVLTQVLTHVVQGGTATAASLGERPVAGKTGTAQENKDAWFVGYTPQLVTAVWMGYPLQTHGPAKGEVPTMGYCADPNLCRPVHGIEVTGGSFPAQIWAAYMNPATADMPIEAFPIPTDMPDEVIHAAPVVPPPAPSPSKTKKSEPKPSEAPQPSEPPVPSPAPSEPAPSEPPGPLPSETPRPRSRGGEP